MQLLKIDIIELFHFYKCQISDSLYYAKTMKISRFSKS